MVEKKRLKRGKENMVSKLVESPTTDLKPIWRGKCLKIKNEQKTQTVHKGLKELAYEDFISHKQTVVIKRDFYLR